MRFLKNKIRLARQFKKQKEARKTQTVSIQSESDGKYSVFSSPSQSPSSKKRRIFPPGVVITPEKIRCTKNIAKNYGSAIATFASSDISLPYLKQYLLEESLSLDDFLEYAKLCKKKITGIDTFRCALLVKKQDSPIVASCKRVFQKVSEVFIKYFSVNWIFTAKILHKLVYLKYRGKMLRRIQNPEYFTYLKN